MKKITIVFLKKVLVFSLIANKMLNKIIGSYNIFTAGNYTKYKNSIHIIFTGQNGGYTNEEDLVAQIKTSVSHFVLNLYPFFIRSFLSCS